MPKVSIITPIWCDVPEKVTWLSEMIESVQSQTLADWEIILINDKSPISLEPVKMRHANDSRLRWVENAANFGPAMTRNTAVALANSECILPLDADDMLANAEALEFMYDTWLMDTSKTVYGNVQLYKLAAGGVFERGKVAQLAHYSFEGAMNLQWGIMPVSTMHSKEAHIKAGGWKADLEAGREDLEYWIACGKAGFCGVKINHPTLLYRKHEQSRDYKLKFENKQLGAMQQKIKELHKDIYEGRYPMACCGKGKASVPAADPVTISRQAARQTVRIVTELNDYEEKDLEWVAYRGPKQGRSGSILARGPVGTPAEYPILGTGHVFQIHKAHRKLFEDRQTLGFEMNQPDPRQQPEPEPVARPVAPEPQVIEVPKPQLSTIVQLDQAAGPREVEIRPAPDAPEYFPDYFEAENLASAVGTIVIGVDTGTGGEIIQEPNPPESISYSMPANPDVSNLGLSPALTAKLDEAGYTVEKLATNTIEDLSLLPGIGPKRAQAIIEKAKKLIDIT